MSIRQLNNKWALLLITAVITGLPLWLINYHTYTNSRIFGIIALSTISILAIFYRLQTHFSVLRLLKVLVGGFLLALIIKILIDTSIDATDHNLWPLELAIAGVAAAVIALVSIGIVSLVKHLLASK